MRVPPSRGFDGQHRKPIKLNELDRAARTASMRDNVGRVPESILSTVEECVELQVSWNPVSTCSTSIAQGKKDVKPLAPLRNTPLCLGTFVVVQGCFARSFADPRKGAVRNMAVGLGTQAHLTTFQNTTSSEPIQVTIDPTFWGHCGIVRPAPWWYNLRSVRRHLCQRLLTSWK